MVENSGVPKSVCSVFITPRLLPHASGGADLCMYVCMCVCTHVCVCLHVCLHVCMYACVHESVYASVPVCKYQMMSRKQVCVRMQVPHDQSRARMQVPHDESGGVDIDLFVIVWIILEDLWRHVPH
jgi:hypothetical protein